MTHTLTFISLAALGAYAMEVPRLDLPPRPVRIMIELDRSAPHLIWDIVNTGYQPVTLTKLIVHGRNGANGRHGSARLTGNAVLRPANPRGD